MNETRGLDDLYLAFRQAKTALWAEKRGVGLLELAQFERNLAKRLADLQSTLAANGGWFDGIDVGEPVAVPKSLTTSETEITGVRYFGPDFSSSVGTIDIRFQLKPSPAFAIVEVLFLWEYGALVDATVPAESVGYRLNRSSRGDFVSRTNRWLFEYWPRRYEEFRNVPLAAARRILSDAEGDAECALVSADLSSFYDNVSPEFLLEETFLGDLRQAADHLGVSFDLEAYQFAARSLLGAYETFRQRIRRVSGVRCERGVPIGALTSRVVANAALAPFDRHLRRHGHVASYRRYVDDLSWVVGKAVGERTPREILGDFLPLLPPDTDDRGTLELDAARLQRHGSRFVVQPKKLRIYRLSGVPGLDFVQSVDAELRRLSSERRALADTAVLQGERPVPFVRPLSDRSAGVRVLREVDRVGIERFATSISLKTLERAARLLPPQEARRVLRFAVDPLVRAASMPNSWVEHSDVMFRLLGLAGLAADWDLLKELVTRTERVWEMLTTGAMDWRVSWNGQDLPITKRALASVRRYLRDRRLEVVCAAARTQGSDGRGAVQLPWRSRLRVIGWSALVRRAGELAEADLRLLDREDDEGLGPKRSETAHSALDLLLRDTPLSTRLITIDKFVACVRGLDDQAWNSTAAHLFVGTRPPTYFDVARRWLYHAESNPKLLRGRFDEMMAVVNALRGTNYFLPVASSTDSGAVLVGGVADRSTRKSVRVILGNLGTEQSSWETAATQPDSRKADLSAQRLAALSDVLVMADRVAGGNRLALREAVLVLPELSVPRLWFRELGRLVARDLRMGLVTGLEYSHAASACVVYNQVVAVLPEAFSGAFVWVWTKRRPAREEEAELRRHGRRFPTWTRPQQQRAVLRTRYGDFSVLVCSELIEARLVADLVGQCDFVLVPAWNPDTSSYDHLVQSAGLQLHAYIGVANNRIYSDCRIWAPRAVRWQRDVCRLVDRASDGVIHADLDLEGLRAFHAGEAVPDANGKDQRPEWKPLPPDWRWPRE